MLANDGVGVLSDACEPLSGVAGRIVLVDRGTCTFVIKANTVQAAGGVGIIVANNVAGPAPGLGGTDPLVTIGVLSISQADGGTLKASLAAAPVTAHMFRLTGTSGTARSTTRSSRMNGATTSTTGWLTAASRSAAR